MGAGAVPVGALAAPAGGREPLVEQLRAVHQEMVEAALGRDGLGRVSQLAAARLERPVAILAPGRGVAVVSPPDGADADLEKLERYAAARVGGRPARLPSRVEAVMPITSGDDAVGIVAMLAGERPAASEASEYLHLAALATLTTLALEDAREHEAARLGAGLIDELRRGVAKREEVVERAARLGCELARGAVVVVTEVRSSRPRQAMALITEECAGAMSGISNGRIYVVLPVSAGDDGVESTVAGGHALVKRLRSYGPTGMSSFYRDPQDLSRAIQEAELVLEVVARDERMAERLDGGIGSGVYRLLFQALASHPEEVKSFYEDTVAPVVLYDEQYHTELLSTLETYLTNDCNMNATARRIFAHRHTVAYRLQRVKDLTGLDPLVTEDRERLSLGLKAFRIVAPILPR